MAPAQWRTCGAFAHRCGMLRAVTRGPHIGGLPGPSQPPDAVWLYQNSIGLWRISWRNRGKGHHRYVQIGERARQALHAAVSQLESNGSADGIGAELIRIAGAPAPKHDGEDIAHEYRTDTG